MEYRSGHSCLFFKRDRSVDEKGIIGDTLHDPGNHNNVQRVPSNPDPDNRNNPDRNNPVRNPSNPDPTPEDHNNDRGMSNNHKDRDMSSNHKDRGNKLVGFQPRAE